MKISLFKITDLPTSIGPDIPDTAVLFVHGLGGSRRTWGRFAEHLHSEWREEASFGLEYDQYYSKVKLFLIGTLFSLWRVIRGVDINSLAKHLKTVIEENCHEYENVIIIAHSMGGLIARQYIVDQLKKEKDLGKLKGLITYATPHHGSSLANYYKVIMLDPIGIMNSPLSFFKSRQIYQLAKNSIFLQELNSDWSNLRVEDKIDFKRVVGYEDIIVDKESSTFNDDDNVKHVAPKGHFSIIKPSKGIKDTAFLVTYNYLKDFHKQLERKNQLLQDFESFDFEDYDDES